MVLWDIAKTKINSSGGVYEALIAWVRIMWITLIVGMVGNHVSTCLEGGRMDFYDEDLDELCVGKPKATKLERWRCYRPWSIKKT